MRSSAPGNSGATVTSRRPSRCASRSASRRRPPARAGAPGRVRPCAHAPATAPPGSNPSGSAPSAGATGIQSRTSSTKPYRSSSGADTPVGRNEVTPWRSKWRAIPSRAARPPIASCPPPPCTWTSTKPGARYGLAAPSLADSTPRSTALIKPSVTVTRPTSTRSSRTSRPLRTVAFVLTQTMYGRRTPRARMNPRLTSSSEPSKSRSSCSMITSPSYPAR